MRFAEKKFQRKGDVNMNEQNIIQESEKEFFTKKAAEIASLKKAGKEEEAKACFRETGSRLVPIVEQFIDCESAQYKLDENTKFMYSEKVYDVVERDFYKFNNPEFMKPEEVGIQYELKTFLKSRTKDCVRDAIARSLGISQYKCRILLKIRSTRFTLSKELQVVEDKVPVELIKERMGNDVDIYTISELIRIEKGYVSLDALKEKGDQAGEYEEMDAVSQGDEIETECKSQLDALFGKLSQLDILIMMKKYGFLGEEFSKMETCEFVITPIFQRLFKEDASIRSRENPVKTVYAKTVKVDKILAEINGKVNMSDVEGKGCLFRYLVERLKKENSK